jgi:hypothetical protein
MELSTIAQILGILNALLIVSAAFMGVRARMLENKQKKDEAERARILIETEEKRSKELDVKLDTRNGIIMKELDVVKSLMNYMSEKIDMTNTRIDESNKVRDEHIHESTLLSDFVRIYNFSFEQSLAFWYTEDEKYRLILKNWGENIRKYAEEYLQSKINKIDSIIDFDPESKMTTMIEEFDSLCNSVVPDYVNKQSFKDWISAKNVHAKSMLLALDVKRNGMTSVQFNKKVATYIFEFSKVYIKAANSWINLLTKKAA